MAAEIITDEVKEIEKLYEYGERLNESKDKSLDYEGILNATKGGTKAKQLASQLIPRFFKFFPDLRHKAVDSHFDLIEADELGIRVQAIRGLPLFCKDTPEYLAKIVDILVKGEVKLRDDEYPSGEFEFKEFGYQWQRVRKGSVWNMKLRGQVLCKFWATICRRELFYYLRGGQVDYGEEHSNACGHSQFGRICEQGNYVEWDEDHPIHFVGHSAGAQVVRVLQQMLADKGYENTSENWVLSITALSGAFNGTTRTYFDGMQPEDGRSLKPICLLQGSMRLNHDLKTFPDTFYFSYATKRTTKIMGITVPSGFLGIHRMLFIRVLQMSRWRHPADVPTPYKGYRDEDWQDNEGALNTISMTHPRLAVEHPSRFVVNDSDFHPILPGIWYYKIVEVDHILFIVNRERAGVHFDLNMTAYLNVAESTYLENHRNWFQIRHNIRTNIHNLLYECIYKVEEKKRD